MKGLERRVVSLEDRRRERFNSLDHLTDKELESVALDLIQRFGDAGVTLPVDWRDQYDRSCIRFLEWLGKEAEALACAA